jgi:hypothetical protein
MYMPKKLSTEKNVSSTKSARRMRVSEDEVTVSPKDLNPLSQKALQTIENNYRQILEMQDRILSAPAMNGGFTTLLFKVENIENSQSQLVEKVDQIHGVLYEPDTGLYARIKNVEKDCLPEGALDDIEKDIQEIKIWKNSEEKLSAKEEAHGSENDKILNNHEIIIKDLQETINKYNTAGKWLIVSVGGGLLSMIGKLIYEFISGHIQIT